MCVCYITSVMFNRVTVACQAPLSMGFSRQAYWSGRPCPPPGIFPTQESNLRLLLPALAGGFFTASATWKAIDTCK